jgi:type 1 fimbriae regulatory protein FimB/type 1 fimbriae regulatory protein FimE
MRTTDLRTVPRLAALDGERVAPKPPGRRSNRESGREREYLTPEEVDRLIKTARRRGRHGARDALAIMMAHRHGLRLSELCSLRWSQVDFVTARLTVHRVKGSIGSTHPICGEELRELRKLQRDQAAGTQFIFMTELGAPMSPAGFQRLLKRVGQECGLPLVHAHMLRHSTGFALADRGRDLREIQDFLGHANVQNSVRYTKLRPGRFDDIWD